MSPMETSLNGFRWSVVVWQTLTIKWANHDAEKVCAASDTLSGKIRSSWLVEKVTWDFWPNHEKNARWIAFDCTPSETVWWKPTLLTYLKNIFTKCGNSEKVDTFKLSSKLSRRENGLEPKMAFLVLNEARLLFLRPWRVNVEGDLVCNTLLNSYLRVRVAWQGYI